MKYSVFVDSNVWLYAMAQSDDALGDIRSTKAKDFLTWPCTAGATYYREPLSSLTP